MTNDSTAREEDDFSGSSDAPEPDLFALAVAWCREEPWRIGEVLLVPPVSLGAPVLFGRGASQPGEPFKSPLGQLRPGQWLPSAPLGARAISREQLSVWTIDHTQNRV